MGDSLKIGKKTAAAKAMGIVAPVADNPVPESSALVLVPASPVAIVEEPQAANAVKLDRSTLAKLDVLVADYVVAIASLDAKDPTLRTRISAMRKLGNDEIKASAQVSSRLLDRPVGSMQKGGLAASSAVGSDRSTLAKLDLLVAPYAVVI